MDALSPGPERPEEHLAHNPVLQSKLDGGEALSRDQLMKTLFLTTVLGVHLEEMRTLNLKTDTPITHSTGAHQRAVLLKLYTSEKKSNLRMHPKYLEHASKTLETDCRALYLKF